MAVNKVIYGQETLMDITDSTVQSDKMLTGTKAYGADGEPVIGNLTTKRFYQADNDTFDEVVEEAEEYEFIINEDEEGGGGGGSQVFVDITDDIQFDWASQVKSDIAIFSAYKCGKIVYLNMSFIPLTDALPDKVLATVSTKYYPKANTGVVGMLQKSGEPCAICYCTINTLGKIICVEKDLGSTSYDSTGKTRMTFQLLYETV